MKHWRLPVGQIARLNSELKNSLHGDRIPQRLKPATILRRCGTA